MNACSQSSSNFVTLRVWRYTLIQSPKEKAFPSKLNDPLSASIFKIFFEEIPQCNHKRNVQKRNNINLTFTRQLVRKRNSKNLSSVWWDAMFCVSGQSNFSCKFRSFFDWKIKKLKKVFLSLQFKWLSVKYRRALCFWTSRKWIIN